VKRDVLFDAEKKSCLSIKSLPQFFQSFFSLSGLEFLWQSLLSIWTKIFFIALSIANIECYNIYDISNLKKFYLALYSFVANFSLFINLIYCDMLQVLQYMTDKNLKGKWLKLLADYVISLVLEIYYRPFSYVLCQYSENQCGNVWKIVLASLGFGKPTIKTVFFLLITL